MKYHHFIAVSLAFFGLAVCTKAQLFIDAAGPRNLVFGAKDPKVPVSERVDLKVDTEKKSATAAYLNSHNTDKGEVVTAGFLLKGSGVNDWESLFKNIPEVELTGLWNYTIAPTKVDGGPIGYFDGASFFNVSGAFKHLQLPVRMTATDPVKDYKSDSGTFTLGAGHVFGNGRNGIALSASYTRDNNYLQLKKVTVDGRDIREGAVQSFDSYPVTLTLTHELVGEWVGELVGRIPAITTGSEKGDIGAILAAYVSHSSRPSAVDSRKAGVNFTVSKRYSPSEKEIAAAKAEAAKLGVTEINPVHLRNISYPFSVFAEWEKPDGMKTKKKVGVAVTFTWP